MADENAQTFEQVVDVFYPKDKPEPLTAPTDEAVTDEEPADDANPEKGDAEPAEDEAGEGEGDSNESEDENGDILIHEINGKEYTAKDIERLENNDKSRQADYTRKTQALAESTKGLESALAKTNDLAAQLEVLVGEDAEINWTELKADDPDEYIRLKERADNREAKLKEAKANSKTSESSNVDHDAERAKLIEANPHWLDGDKPTKEYKADMDLITAYYDDSNWSQSEMKRVSESASLIQLVLEDAKRKEEAKITETKTAKARKKIIATPKAGKSKAQAIQKTAAEIFYGKN